MASPTDAPDGSYVGSIWFRSLTGTTYRNSAIIATKIDGISGTNVGGYIELRTRDITGTMNKVLVIDASKHVGINQTSPEAELHVVGKTISTEGYEIISASPSDHLSSGIRTTMTMGETVVFGNVLYQNSDGELYKTDADAAATMPCIAMALESGADGETKSVLLFGFVRDDTWTWTVGGEIYASLTAGAMTQTKPSVTGDQVQIIGMATHADRMLFNPNSAMVKIS